MVSLIQLITNYVKFGLLGQIWPFGSPLTWLFVSERRSLARQGSVTGPFLSPSQLETITQSLVISSLDYCNSLYYGANSAVLKQLQLIQNRACRIIKGLKRRDGIEPYLQELHWLKIQERIEFKILLLTFKAIHGLAPPYLSNVVKYNSSGSRDIILFCPSNTSTKAFSAAAPKLWNNLPHSIKQLSDIDIFKRMLKAHLFRKSYNLYN